MTSLLNLCIFFVVVALTLTATGAQAQSPTSAPQHQHDEPTWHVMQDGVAFGTFNHQGGPAAGATGDRRTGGWRWRGGPWARVPCASI